MRAYLLVAVFGLILSCLPAAKLEALSSPLEEAMDLEKMLFQEINVASIKPMTLRESPGIVTLVTAEEIARSGARDLIDVLRVLPGIEFGVDVQGCVSLGIRGNWANEGKVLLLWDGQEINEPLYSTVQFGNHFPVDQIQEIQIIRGPGSAIYGGYAELAVIKIETKGGRELNGGMVSGRYGQMNKIYGQRNLQAAYGQPVGDKGAFSLSAFAGQGTRSDRDFTDFNQDTYALAGNSSLDPLQAEVKMDWAGWEGVFLVDRFHTTQRDEMAGNLADPVDVDFYGTFASLKYSWQVAPGLSLTPDVHYKWQSPYRADAHPDALTPNFYYRTVSERTTGSLLLSWDLDPGINLLAGSQYQYDYALDCLPGDDYPPVIYQNTAGYIQGIANTPWIHVTAGARYERHSVYGESFVPRIGLTKIIDAFHIKLLGNYAFRSPSIENIRLNSGIKPERTLVGEFEAGYVITKNAWLTVNLFDISFDNPIIYGYDSVNMVETYLNYSRMRTRGFECELRCKDEWGYLTANYSFYTAVENNVDLYAVPGQDGVLLGFSTHKINLAGSLNIWNGLSVNPTVTLLSDRYGYTAYAADGLPQADRFAPLCLANIFIYYEQAFIPNLQLGAGVNNLLDAPYAYIQPYNGEHAPLPGPSREVQVKATYQF